MPEEKSFDISGGATLEMVRIDPGSFPMGSPESEAGRWPDEGPVHEVTIGGGFYLARTPVTQFQWEAVMGTTPWTGRDFVREGPDYPATYVSWEDAGHFLEKVGDGFRLPTEAEWEYACRAGTASAYSFGESAGELEDYAWYRENAWEVGQAYAHPVGGKRPSPAGLYDMHGNIWEWCQDAYGPYQPEAVTDPSGAEKGDARILRGSGFASEARALRSAFRYSYTSNRQFHCIGFRPARTLSG
jgi:formylglycine-generating enzyme required for sulfatase activity